MSDRDGVLAQIHAAFARVERPPDAFLQGSHEGCEPFEEVEPFRGRAWQSLAPAFLDARYCALGFFSEGGFRYFLPAYLVADLQDGLQTADPVFHLTHGFYEIAVESSTPSLTIRTGKSVLLNPRRYGGMRWEDYARFRLSVFTREECAAIVAYLEYRRERPDALDREAIDAALRLFWLERARTAPTQEELATHLRREAEHLTALLSRQPHDPAGPTA